ncbi:MAG TPA: hypothetical protein VK808_10715, partial [Bacteroidia bacterium]|nr:hypothetical protein [Bacteroidia bacterium]
MPRLSSLKNTLFVFLCLLACGAFAQSNPAPGPNPNDTNCNQVMDNQKAVDLYTKGTDKKKYQKEERMTFLKQALDLEPDYVAANFAMGEEIAKTAYLNKTVLDPTVPYFLKVINACPHYHSDPYYYVGISAFEANAYDEAIKYLQKYVDYKDEDPKKFNKDYDGYLYDAKQKLKEAKFYFNILTNKVPFDPHMVKGLCTSYNEYLAIISPDNQEAYFTRRMPVKDRFSSTQSEESMKEYFMVSHRQDDGTFDAGIPMAPPFNRGMNEGGPTITIDNKHLYFTIGKPSADGGTSFQLYYSDFANGQWGDIKNMGQQVNDPSAWNSQPSISSDGVTLYFASNRPGGMGKCDLYKTIKDQASGDWGSAINLGPGINTAGNEKSPFIHTDSHTLYFSSDGWPGVGGFDIFYSRQDTAGKWSEPKNIGYPINSNQDEVGFFVSTDGKTGYFCSNDPDRTNGENMGGYDIYQFDLYKEARPEKVALLTGKITDDAGNAITGATITIRDAKTHKTAAIISDTVNASYAAVVNVSQNQQYVATVTKKGYAFNSGIITSKDTFTGKPTDMTFN